jgi:hypothetical protein
MKRKRNSRPGGFIRGIPRFELFRAGSLALSFFVSAVLIFAFSRYNRDQGSEALYGFNVGMAAPRDLVLEEDLVYLDYESTELQRQNMERLVVPSFAFKPEVTERVRKSIHNFRIYLQTRRGRNLSPGNSSSRDLPYSRLFVQNELDFITRRASDNRTLTLLSRYAEEILSAGFYHVPKERPEMFLKGLIEIPGKNIGEGTTELVNIESLITRDKLKTVITAKSQKDGLVFEQSQGIYLMALTFLEENVFFDEHATKLKLDNLRAGINPVFKHMPRGAVLIAEGSIVTEADIEKIRLLSLSKSNKSAANPAAAVAYLAMLYGLSVLLMRPPMLDKRLNRRQFFMVIILNVLYFIIALFLRRMTFVGENYPLGVFLPSALISMLSSIFISYRAGVVNTAILSLAQLIFAYPSPESVAFVFFSGVMGIKVIRKAEKRIDLLMGGLILAVAHGVAVLILSFLTKHTVSSVPVLFMAAFFNGLVCGILNIALLPLIEHLMNAATKFRLLELSDLNSPILKRMLSLAPGTYHHSVNVAHLAETACRDIGADSLLARTGSYFHDIGKIDQAEYFIENQNDFNKHDILKPSLSSAIIKSHVKIGLQQGAKLGLPEEVLAIIAQHHGSGLIRIFYQRALENSQGGTSPEDYSYAGSPPASKEAAVVMLADSVEAASRVLKKSGLASIEKAVGGIIEEKVESHQLDESDLTLKDLEKIKKAFVRVLAGYFHSRIEYPKIKELQR